MPNHINSKNTLETYGADDLYFAYAVAHESTEWLSILISQARMESKELQVRLKEQGVHASNFYKLQKLLDLTEFFAEERVSHFEHVQNGYKEELESNKKAVTL
jgi:hypothetical protein